MTNDPFATAPAQDEAQQETTPTTETSKEKPLTTLAPATDQSKLTLTFKGGAGYDAPWVVVHANNPAEANEIILDEDFKSLLENVQRVGGAFGEMAPNKPAAPAKKSNGQPAGAAQAPNGETPPPGYMFKSGIGKNGKPWKAFMPIDRNSGLEVIWLR